MTTMEAERGDNCDNVIMITFIRCSAKQSTAVWHLQGCMVNVAALAPSNQAYVDWPR